MVKGPRDRNGCVPAEAAARFVSRSRSAPFADVDAAVNFGNGSVALQTSNTVYLDGTGTFSEPDYGVSGSGTLTGADDQGSLDSSRRSGLQEEFRGELFGGAAEETGGVIVFQNAGTTYGAAFGASRTPGQID